MTEPARPIRIVLVDDHPAILDAISGAAASTDDLAVIATARTFDAALTRLTDPAAERPDVVVSDIQLAGEAEGLRLLERLAASPDAPPVLFLSSFDQPALLRAAFEKGASGFVTKTAEVGAILNAVRTVARGGTVFSATALRAVRTAPRRPSDRELEVLAQVCAGASNDEVAMRLGLSEKTVESHLRRLFDRYGVLSRTELAVLAVREGWIGEAPVTG